MTFRPGPLVHAILATEGPRLVDILISCDNTKGKFFTHPTAQGVQELAVFIVKPNPFCNAKLPPVIIPSENTLP